MVHIHKGRAALSPSSEPSQQPTEAGHVIVHGLEMRKLTESFANLPSVTQLASGGPQAHMQVAEPMLFTPTAQASLKPPGSLQLLSEEAVLLAWPPIFGSSACPGLCGVTLRWWHSLPMTFASPWSPEVTLPLADMSAYSWTQATHSLSSECVFCVCVCVCVCARARTRARVPNGQ